MDVQRLLWRLPGLGLLMGIAPPGAWGLAPQGGRTYAWERERSARWAALWSPATSADPRPDAPWPL